MGKITNIIVNNLNYHWFLKVKKRFDNHILYSPKTNKLHYKDQKDDGEDYPELILELKEFAWNPFIDEKYYKLSGDDTYLYFAAYKYIDEIIEYVQEEIKPYPPKDQYKYLIALNKSIKRTFERIKEYHQNKEHSKIFHETLDYICENGLNKLNNHFERLLKLHSLIDEGYGTLSFNLNQDELAVLMIILERSGIIAVQETQKTIAVFAREYFCFRDAFNGEHKKAKSIESKISDSKNVRDIKNKISKIQSMIDTVKASDFP